VDKETDSQKQKHHILGGSNNVLQKSYTFLAQISIDDYSVSAVEEEVGAVGLSH